MTLADSHVKALLKEGTGRAGPPPSGSEWRVAPEASAAAKEKAEDYLRRLGEESARRAGQARRSTLKADDVQEPGGSSGGAGGDGGGDAAPGGDVMPM